MSEPRPETQYIFDRLEGRADDFNPLDRANYNNFETDEITRLEGQIRLLTAALQAATSQQDGQGEALAVQLLLDDVRAAFRKAYANIPPILSQNWGFDVVAALLGVTR